ncbi:hypothetical protein [Flexithrix dorotheae]|uniref:hypothetical protein n=1 Tax=Flexithrix dorotheae TaxID=70993 RepID=UPI0012FBB328|nr:hypothetical protein [Flexithrix dorotheae]
METNKVKEFFMRKFYRSYIIPKDYFDRFFSVFIVLMMVSLVCQAYSGWSEYAYFLNQIVGNKHVYAPALALILNIVFEVLKTAVISKFMTEFLGPATSFNVFFLSLGLALMAGSVYFSYNGVTDRAREAIVIPEDTKTAETDRVFTSLLAEKEKQISVIKKKYTWEGNYYLPPTGNKYHTSAEVSMDTKKLEQLESQKNKLHEEYASQRNLNIQEHDENISQYKTTLASKVKTNRYNVIFSESLYLICMVFGFYFGYKSANEYFNETDKPNGNLPDPEDDSEDQPDDQETTSETPEIGALPTPIFQFPQNEECSPTASGVTESEKLTEFENRICKADGCGKTFQVNIRKEVSANPKKYCSTKCAEKMKRIRNQENKIREKWKITSNRLEDDERSITWKKTL